MPPPPPPRACRLPPAFALADATQRALLVVPALGLQLRALADGRRGTAAVSTSAGAGAAALSARSAALVFAATGMFGRLSTGGASPGADLATIIGEPARRLLGGGGGGGQARGSAPPRPPLLEQGGGGIDDDDEEEGGAVAIPAATAQSTADAGGGGGGGSGISLAGLLVGEWEATAAALRRVNVAVRPPLLATSAGLPTQQQVQQRRAAAALLSLPGNDIED